LDAAGFLDSLRESPDYREQIVHVQYIPSRAAIYSDLETGLDPAVSKRLGPIKTRRLFRHQAEAIDLILGGHSVIIATPAASGKSLCYQVPIIQTLYHEPASCALMLFPTKALARDQQNKLVELASPDLLLEESIAIYDGDTDRDERQSIRQHARVLITNPDMLHIGILPSHKVWTRFIRNLRYVILDEAHSYRGIFGSHVGNIIRRLRRICRAHGSTPGYVLSSATIGNPIAHAMTLTGLDCRLIKKEGSAQGRRVFAFWNPPVINQAKSIRRSPTSEASFLLYKLVSQGYRSLAFARTRRLTELVYRYTRDRLGFPLSSMLKPYRAGYLAKDRRRIERELHNGDLKAVIATSALEMGVDIGDLEATLLIGYPGTISSAWQQAGRSGREADSSSLSILIAAGNPLDQYFMRYPDYFFSRSFENALSNPANPYILSSHLLCAAWEKPLDSSDLGLFGDSARVIVEQLTGNLELRNRGLRWYLSPSITYPASQFSIRSASRLDYALVDQSNGFRLLETIPSYSALSQVHTGAIYFHQGDGYVVKQLDLVTRTALAEPANLPYYTTAREVTNLRIDSVKSVKQIGPVSVYFGQVTVSNQITGYTRKRQSTEEFIDHQALDLPEQTFSTQSLWFDIPDQSIRHLNETGLDFAGGLHALEHAAIGILPLFAMCDRNDIGGVSTPCQSETGKPQIFIYDAHPGGIGIAEMGYNHVTALWSATANLIAGCPCIDGCPSCTQSPKCGNNNEPLDKKAALLLLEALV
jgi:DEAD/DEAH box helicase domain-containing protein